MGAFFVGQKSSLDLGADRISRKGAATGHLAAEGRKEIAEGAATADPQGAFQGRKAGFQGGQGAVRAGAGGGGRTVRTGSAQLGEQALQVGSHVRMVMVAGTADAVVLIPVAICAGGIAGAALGVEGGHQVLHEAGQGLGHIRGTRGAVAGRSAGAAGGAIRGVGGRAAAGDLL